MSASNTSASSAATPLTPPPKQDHAPFWDRKVKPWLDIIQAVGVVVAAGSLVFAAQQTHLARGQLDGLETQIQDAEKSEAVTVALEFDNRLREPGTSAVLSAAADGRPVYVVKDGRTNWTDLQQAFADFDDVYYLSAAGIMDQKTAQDFFCSDANTLSQSDDAMKQLNTARRLSNQPNAMRGFEKLVSACAAWTHSG